VLKVGLHVQKSFVPLSITSLCSKEDHVAFHYDLETTMVAVVLKARANLNTIRTEVLQKDQYI